ncbi:RagB/SusD family nutrient uptake outer membrane protein [Mariniflexile litorale]|uniref:RagB/SusD family nutrient uptake outer membrane protein n=1 Tax=Mariniflexile litorale TaxID=3045158 RepID=A0AAU7EGY8_9FLAO|nr:RagB/SusD family nutrient uptake outer membrane protein [Mariniflexile sp. KMM 9835]MDQ8211936.1 RagB/SusD family nutrient uptake outer membrane protein [Mariniflexile sp. KMM 9835]
MKNINIIIGTFILLFGMSSCSDYLDVVPDNVAIIDHAFRSRNEAEKFLFTCYSYRPEIGSVDKDPAMASDEIFKRYGTNGGSRFWENTRLQLGFQESNNPILNVWDGERSSESAWKGIRDCNIFLEKIHQVTDMDDYEMNRWISEVKFLKAYYHYYLFKCYGPIPIVDVNIETSAEEEDMWVYREPIDEVIKYITDLMLESITDLPAAIEIVEGTEAGRVDKLIAYAIRAEALVYAASPLFNGNKDYANMIDNRGIQLFPQSYNENKWLLAANACKEAIDVAHTQGKALYDLLDPFVLTVDPIFQLQTTYREAICARWNKELIWGNTRYDNGYLQRSTQVRLVRMNESTINRATSEYAPTINMVERYYSSNGVPINEDRDWVATNNWYGDRYQIRAEAAKVGEERYVELGKHTVNLHFNREPRFYASVGFDKGVYFGNGNYLFTGSNRDVKYADFLKGQVSGFQGGSGYSITGYSTKKMHSFKNTQTNTQTTEEFYPFPIMRLADLYLLYSEALNEANGSAEDVFEYVDLIRNRVGLEGVIDSWSQYSVNPTKPNSKEGRREIIHQERGIELAFEGKRYWDIKRWKKIPVLNDQPKGWNMQGTVKEDFYKVLLLPEVPLSFSTKDYFWPIKESNLSRNANLIQNYGW